MALSLASMSVESHAPVAEADRSRSLDVLRGVAVLGILVMNSRNFALPLQQFDNPAFPGQAGSPARRADLWSWGVANVLFEDKMIAILSMLFGAGIVLGGARAVREARAAIVHYRRMFWLLVIGLLHAYGLWYGDILNTYAICGMAIYPVRRARPAVLICLGVLVLSVAIFVRVGPRVMDVVSAPAATAAPTNTAGAGATQAATESPAASATPSTSPAAAARESRSDRIWRVSLAEEQAAYQGSWWNLATWRARLNTLWHFDGGITFSFWRCGGFILIGMGLVQLGLLTGTAQRSTYWSLILAGYGVGLALMLVGFWPQLTRTLGRSPQMSPEARTLVGSMAWTLRYAAAGGIALGHISVVMLLCQSRVASPLLAPLAAVGRMALSCYLMHTLVCIALFDGWALGQWGTWRMSQVAVLVGGIWITQLLICPIWLRLFLFGPAEWTWRSLTHWKLQPFMRRATT
ncbi:MAG: DUF418 domain-containing protein [Phycisphaerales bacterium]